MKGNIRCATSSNRNSKFGRYRMSVRDTCSRRAVNITNDSYDQVKSEIHRVTLPSAGSHHLRFPTNFVT